MIKVQKMKLVMAGIKKDPVKTVMFVISIISMILTIIIYLTSLQYSFFYTDDYTHSGMYFSMNSSIGEVLPFALRKTADAYQVVGGYYSSFFFEYLLDPLCYSGFSTLHFWMAFLFGYFYLSIVLCLNLVFRKIYNDPMSAVILSGCFCWVFFNYRTWTETIFWFTGAMAYTMPLASLLFMFFFFIIGHEKKKKVFCLISVVFGIMAMGGVLCVAFLGCIVIILLIIGYIRKKTIQITDIIISCLIIAFGLVNALSPGNFARQTIYDASEGIHIMDALWYSLRTNIIQLEKLLKNTGFPLILMIAFVVGLRAEKDISSRVSLRKVLLAFLFPVVAVFPACLGYASPYMPNRVLFIGDFFLVFSMLFLALQIGCSVAGIMHEEWWMKILQTTACLMAFIMICAMPYRLENGEIYKLGKAETEGSLQSYYQEIRTMDSYLRSMKGKNVEIALPTPIDGFLDFLMEEDPDHWVNKEIAGYYGNKSVKRVD